MGRKRIILADDVELFLMLEKTVFNRNEFELITSRSGREILKLIRERNPDLVFMTLSMTDINGEECCRAVKENESSSHIPVIMVIRGGEEETEKCRLSKCDDILLKPIEKSEFLEITHKYIRFMERSDRRVRARIPINYRVISDETLKNYSIDINTGGMFLETNQPLMADTPIELEFLLPGNDFVVRCKGRKAWVNDPLDMRKPDLPPGMGIQFLDISQRAVNAIRDYLNSSAMVGCC